MKNPIVKILFFTGMALVASSFSGKENDTQKHEKIPREVSKAKTYNIRYGLLTKSGVKTLSGSYDVGSFVATNTVTGETFETYAGGGMQSLPKYFDGLPAGNYTFTAMQGQGGWVGYGSVTAEVSDAKIDADGYVTVYVPIAWEE
ncbi:hypothetical protein [Chryseobacterium ginsengisoli]